MVKWKGVKKAQGKLNRMASGIDKQLEDGLSDFGDYAEQQIKVNAVFTKGYSRGHLKRAITSNKKGRDTIVESPAYYSGWVEWGTRYMEAQPFFFPTLKRISPELGKFIMKK